MPEVPSSITAFGVESAPDTATERDTAPAPATGNGYGNGSGDE
jgi:hypothetical protein